jgi:hypothetical protein
MRTTSRIAREKRKGNKRYGRAAVTNGTFLFLGVDHRSRAARRFRDLYRSYLKQTNGRHDELCKQAAALVLKRELLDADLVVGKHVDISDLVKLSGAINRTLARLNLSAKDPDIDRRRREREDREALLA